MILLLTIFLILISIVLIVKAPWCAAALYALVSILQPQYVWFWSFEDFSVFKVTAGVAIVAWGIYLLRGKIDWGIYKNGIAFGIIFLLLVYNLSELLSPFQNYYASVGSTLVMGVYFTITIMFCIVLGLMNSKIALNAIVWVVIAATIYYAYWANDHYFSSNWSQFNQNRLLGPARSPYSDGNNLSILYVIGMPFVLFAIFNVKAIWQKGLLIFSLPFILHALVLCASRGAFVAIAVSTLMAAFMLKSKKLNFVLLVGFIIFIGTQGGQLLNRTTSTVESAKTEAEEPLNPRLVSWEAAFGVFLKHPIVGAGPQRFQQAARTYYPENASYVAHSTVLNFAANLGFFGAITYLMFFYISWKMFKNNKKLLEIQPNTNLEFINKASICSLSGFFVGALFLDLIIFEPFFFLLLIIVSNNYLIKKEVIVVQKSKVLNSFALESAKVSAKQLNL
jgi:O-antigen ligase